MSSITNNHIYRCLNTPYIYNVLDVVFYHKLEVDFISYNTVYETRLYIVISPSTFFKDCNPNMIVITQ